MIQVILYALACLGLSFALGSIPWGLIVSKLFFKTDIREHGSGNIGTANALRTLGVVGGAAVFALDFLKGLVAGAVGLVLAVLAALDLTVAANAAASNTESLQVFGVLIDGSTGISAVDLQLFGLIQGLSLLGCILGHNFSPWLKFKGGKGIAVAVGCAVFAFGWWATLIELVVFALLVILTRYVSVGSIAAVAVAPFIAWWVSWGEPLFVAIVTLAAVLVIWAHRGNIIRLRAGTENRIGAAKADSAKASSAKAGGRAQAGKK